MIHDLSRPDAAARSRQAPLEVPRAAQARVALDRAEAGRRIAFTEFTSDGILRHPSFIALREDKPATEVVREKPQKLTKSPRRRSASAAAAEASASRSATPTGDLSRRQLTKGDLADYYAAIEALMMVDTARGRSA
jgi:bifunctional non-homologous end joining protein LigD